MPVEPSAARRVRVLSSPERGRRQDILERLLTAFPERREALLPYVERAKRYRNDCGCAMSGAFLIAAILAVAAWTLRHGGVGRPGPLAGLALAVAFVFGAGVAGKLLGVGVARLRLALLYRALRGPRMGSG